MARPHDSQAVADWVTALRDAHRPGEAVRVVERALKQQGPWLDSEANPLFEHWTYLLYQRRDMDALLRACEAWIRTEPGHQAAYARYLSALLFLDRGKEADAWVKARFAATMQQDLGPEERAALGGAIQHALGQGWNYRTQRIDEQWWQPLGDLARRLLQGHRPSRHLASRILNHWSYRRTDAYAALQQGLLEDLTADGAIESMDLDRLAIYLSRIPWAKADSDARVWRGVVDRLKARWNNTPLDGRAPLATHVLRLLDLHGERAEALAFARERLQGADDDHRPDLAWRLLQRLAREKWTAALEDEMLRVLPAVPYKGVADERRRATYSMAIRWLSDQLVRMRIEALLGPLQEREKLPRKQLRLAQRKARAEARTAVAARFAAERDRSEEHARPWFRLERLCLLARLGEKPKEVDGETRELMAHAVDPGLQERCAYVLAYLATRRKAPAGLADAAVTLLEKRAAGDAGPLEMYVPDWKYHFFRLLVALDRTDALAARLGTWIVPSQVESRWRIAYGYLVAERGKLADAAAAFEEVKRIDELGAADHEALANWYLVLGDEPKRKAALLGRYLVMPEWQLRQRLYEEQNAIRRRGEGVPRELEPDVLRALRALLAKASRPANHIYFVRKLYLAVKDFRLLESLPYGVLGHTPEGIYPYLQSLGRVLDEVHEEATCDALAARIRELMARADRDVDRRGLLLLQVLVERRAGDVLNQPGPHARKGLEALQASFKGAWLPGERRHMAALLAWLRRIPQAPFAAEQVRQLEALHRLESAGTLDRLSIAQSLFETHWAYGRKDRAVDGLTAALDEYQRTHDALTSEALPALDRLVGWLSERGHFRTAETRLEAELAAPPAPAVRDWLHERLFRLYVEALGRKGRLAIGQGKELYEAARQRMAAAMWQYGPDRIATTLIHYCALHRTAQKRAGILGAGRDLEAFAYAKLLELTRRVPTNAHRLASTVANTLRDLRGPRPALAYVITYLEQEPAWWRRVGRIGWGTFARSLAKWRAKAGPLGDLEPHLLAIVVSEIERDLLSLQALNRAMYRASNRWFWREKQEAFLAVALRVVETNPDSPARLQYAAKYIWSGLHRYDRAIAVLLEADRRGRLREAGRHTLVLWLHERKRYPESLPQLEKLLAARPDKLEYHALKIVALHFSGRDADARQALDEADRRFRKPPRTAEKVLATLARACRECGFFERAVPYYEEVIPLHQRTQPNRGIGRGTLSLYYGELAECYVALGRHRKAVDAASAAVVSWGRTHQNRATALRALQAVIAAIPDLDGYVVGYEIQVKKTGLDAPLVRKALGLAYLQRDQPMRAVPHLRAARDLQPLDMETHQALLRAYDDAGKPDEARRALLQSIAVAPLELDLYAELGRRLKAAGDARGAERAWTSLAEAKPNEADGHRRLAQHREKEQRYGDAILQWRQVVRIRTDEPAGWLSLAQAQLKAGRSEGAGETLEHVLATKWDERFGDVHRKAARLRR